MAQRDEMFPMGELGVGEQIRVPDEFRNGHALLFRDARGKRVARRMDRSRVERLLATVDAEESGRHVSHGEMELGWLNGTAPVTAILAALPEEAAEVLGRLEGRTEAPLRPVPQGRPLMPSVAHALAYVHAPPGSVLACWRNSSSWASNQRRAGASPRHLTERSESAPHR